MATIVLSSLGSMLGPLGQIAGTFAGSAIDNALFGPADREGPRLKELAVTGSSYGTPMAAVFGAMRVPGTIIWSTDLQEQRNRQSNGKGQPKTVSYTYSVSFAVALSSRPIERIGRIWADGNLLRGAGGDLKAGGTLRVHSGLKNQQRDPLMAAALGVHCPAFRGCAYAVFENLDLTDFGNRIPALSFEIFADDGRRTVESMLDGLEVTAEPSTRFPELTGFSFEGGSLRNVVEMIDRVHPLIPSLKNDGLSLIGAEAEPIPPTALPEPASWEEGDFGQLSGRALFRSNGKQRQYSAIRYYDPARDYQPGMQYADNAGQVSRVYQFPAALSATAAKELARKASNRDVAASDRLSWRLAELNPAIGPGSLVKVPGTSGVWKVTEWEWRECGVEVELVRYRQTENAGSAADPGLGWASPDRLASPTSFRVFETPWDGLGSSSKRRVFAAASAFGGRWSGASLFGIQDGTLIPTAQSLGQTALIGHLEEAMTPSNALRLEPASSLVVRLTDPDADLPVTTVRGIAQGANRVIVGHEIVQYLDARPAGEGVWRLTGLLRGRGATEGAAYSAHQAGTAVTFLEYGLLALDDETLTAGPDGFAAIGLGDEQAVVSALDNAGASHRPPCPVHPARTAHPDGSISFSWTRRARGQWTWLDEVEQPLIEEFERYLVGLGPVDTPLAEWVCTAPALTLTASDTASLRQSGIGMDFWVRQSGSFALSHPVHLGTLD